MPRLFAALFFMDADVLQLCNLRTSVDSLESSECLLSWMSTNVSLVYRRFVYRITYTILLSYPSIHWSILILLSTSQVSGWSLIFHWVLSGNPTCVANEGMESWSVGGIVGDGRGTMGVERKELRNVRNWLVSKSDGPAFRQPKWQQLIVPVMECSWSYGCHGTVHWELRQVWFSMCHDAMMPWSKLVSKLS